MQRSFRDPSGSVFRIGDRLFRLINRSGVADFEAFVQSETSRRFIDRGQMVRTEVLESAAGEAILAKVRDGFSPGFTFDKDTDLLVEHEVVPFPSFPYEWSPEMLYEAASLTLDLADSLLKEGLGLKDATPYNVLYRGPVPVFVDVLSVEKRRSGDPTWLPDAQFVRTFLLPLLVNKQFGLPLDQLLTVRRDGLEPEEVFRLCGGLKKLSPPFLSLVTIPTWLSGRHKTDDNSIYQKKDLGNPEKAQFILESLFKRLHRVLKNVKLEGGQSSTWSDYLSSHNYSEEHFQAKQKFIEAALDEFRPRTVLDIGCNTGFFSSIAAKNGASVVSIDFDPAVVGETWRKARNESLDILPLVVNISRPSPGLGWRNQECSPFLERARGAFDAVFMLAVIHHLLVTERVPLEEVISLAAELTIDLLIIEFIAPEDSMFRRIIRGRDELHAGLTVKVFEDACMKQFEIIRSQHLEDTSRWLYLLRKRAGEANA